MRSFFIKIFILIICLYSLLIFCIFQIKDLNTRVWFLDVGQGDSIFIKASTGETILIDGGPNDSVLQELSSVMPFFNRTIDLVVLTHPHADHINGLIAVLKRFKVDSVLITGVNNGDAGYKEFLQLIYDKKIPVFYANSKTDYKLGPIILDIIFPIDSIEGAHFLNLNNSSITMRLITKNGVSFLSGDLEIEGENKILSSGQDVRSDVFKAGHHGSKTASSLALLEKTEAFIGVITCGIDNPFNHPHAITVNNFMSLNMRIFRTDIDGRIEISSPYGEFN